MFYVKLIKYSYIYKSMYTKYNYTYLCKSIYILIKNEDFYMNTIGDMQYEKYFYGYYKVFEYNHDYVIFC